MTATLQIIVNVYAAFVLLMLLIRSERGLLLLIPMVPLATYTYRSPVTGLNVNNILIYTAFSMGLLRRMGRREPLPPATTAIVTFFGLTLVSWLVGIVNYRSDPYPYETVRWFINIERWVLYTLLYFAFYFGWSEKVSVRAGFRSMMVGVFIAAAWSLLEIVFPSKYLIASQRAGGLFGQANSSGIFLASFGFLPIVFASTTRSTLKRAFFIGTFAMVVIGIVLSVSRAAMICLIAGGLVYTYYSSRRAFAGFLAALFIMIPSASLLLPAHILQRYTSTFEGSSYEGVAGKLEGSAANRYVQNVAGAKLFIDSPIIGHGLGGFYYRSPKYLPPGSPDVARSPHSTFLEITVEGGITVVACFVWLLAGIGYTGKRLYESDVGKEERLYGLYLMTIVVAKSIANLFNTEFLTGDVSAYLWVSAALVAWQLARAPAKSRAAARSQRVASPWRPRAGAEIRRPVTHG